MSALRPAADMRRCRSMIAENKAYWIVIGTLVILIAAALWQFHSLAWGEDVAQSPRLASPRIGIPQDPLIATLPR